MAMTVQMHPDEYQVEGHGRANPFVVVKAIEGDGQASLFLKDVAACDALIRAAMEAKDKLIQATGAQVRIAADEDGGEVSS